MSTSESAIIEISPSDAAAENGSAKLIDVRDQNEWDSAGYLAGAVLVPRAQLEDEIASVVPDRDARVILYCATGKRSARGAATLHELGYTNVVSLAGGYTAWQAAGLPTVSPVGLEPDQALRYSRHLLIPEIGVEGQLKLLNARVLMIGAGGLGSPAALYLAAAGVGRIGIVDADVVDETNLQRQIIHSLDTVGHSKVSSAKRTLEALNPDVDVVTYDERLTSENVERILGDGWDVIVDGADNFPTRYLVNDASVWHDIPVVHGSIYRFEGQATVFKPHSTGSAAGKAGDARPEDRGPCYRCLFPQPPPPELAPSCAEGGVLGVLPGIIGSLQANEAIKLITGVGEPLIGRLLLFDAQLTTFDEVAVKRDPTCPVCGDAPTITEYVDYVEFCAGPGAQH